MLNDLADGATVDEITLARQSILKPVLAAILLGPDHLFNQSAVPDAITRAQQILDACN